MALAQASDVDGLMPGRDPAAVALALSYGESAVTSFCRRVFDVVVDDVAVITTADYEGLLPQWPVTAVSKVEVKEIDSAGAVSWTEIVAYDVTPQGVIYSTLPVTRSPWPFGLPGGLRVTYTHGYDPIPAPIRDAVIRVACAFVDNPSGRVKHKVGDNEDGWSAASAGALSPYDEAILAAYCTRGIR